MCIRDRYNAEPHKASRAFDRDRDGFVIAGGGGALVIEELEHAKRRGAKIYAELTGYAATSDGHDMVSPSGEGALRCMETALDMSGGENPDYINAHGTSTPVGDIAEIEAIHNLFGKNNSPLISSTKSLTGHSLGAAGVQESIYSLIMLNDGFLCASVNIDSIDENISDANILEENKQGTFKKVMSNSFGFGGTNACLVFDTLN